MSIRHIVGYFGRLQKLDMICRKLDIRWKKLESIIKYNYLRKIKLRKVK